MHLAAPCPFSRASDVVFDKKDNAAASTFRRRLLALADQYEQLQMENVALKKQLEVTTNVDQQGKAATGCAALSVYEVALDQPLLPSTPEGTLYSAMPSFDHEVLTHGKAAVAPIWQGAFESSPNDNCHAGIDIVVADSSIPQQAMQEVTDLPKCEAQKNELFKISENVVHGVSRMSEACASQIMPAVSLRTAAATMPAADSEKEFSVSGTSDDTALHANSRHQAAQALSSGGQKKSVRISHAFEGSQTSAYGRESVSPEMMQSQFLSKSLVLAGHSKRSSEESSQDWGRESWQSDGDCERNSFLPGFQKASPHLQAVFEVATMRALDECYTKDRDAFVVSPLSYRRMLWDAILFFCVLFELWVTPFELLFLRSDALPNTFRDVSNAMTLVFLIDIATNFNTGYIRKGEIVMKRSMIVRQYMSCWFWLDLLSSLPFDWLFSLSDGDMMRGVRFGKALRISRAARYLRIMLSYRRRKQVLRDRSRKNGLLLFAMVRPTVPLFCILFVGHIHACMLAAFSNQRLESKLLDALRDYYQCYWQAWTCLFMGAPLGPKEGDFDFVFLFDMLASVERICFLAVGGVWAVVYARTRLSDYMRMMAEKDSAIKYLKSHALSMETQLQFRFSLEEMAKAQNRQNHFQNLVNDHQLTEELHRRICCELWASRLMSFGLITQIAAINAGSDFIMELCLCVREEVFASKTVLFHYGDAAIAAYCVLTGRLSAVKVPGYLSTTPDYETGHWLGESALVNPLLRRSMSVITKDMSELMAVPADSFQSLLVRLGLTDYFQQFIQAHLWKGLCARCGVIGDHFADMCPGIKAHRYTKTDLRKSSPRRRTFASRTSMFSVVSTTEKRKQGSWATFNESFSSFKSGMMAALSGEFLANESQPVDGIASDLWRYLKEQNLVFLTEHLKKLGIVSLDDLVHMDHAALKEALPEEMELTEQEWKMLSPARIERFISRAARAVQKQIFDSVSTDHYIFLSHAKLESGTEAALMRTELENLIRSDTDSTLNDFDVPIFLDSEDLKSLTDLQDVVDKTHNLVLLLSPTVLQRVWVLVEIATAQKVGVRVVPVHVSKPGTNFEFPKDEFYEKFRSGETLQPDDKGIMEAANLTLEEVEAALRSVFKEIAVPYSPHMSSHMRRAQLECLLKRCRLK